MSEILLCLEEGNEIAMKINNNSSMNVGKLYQTYQNQAEKTEKKQEVSSIDQDNLQLSEQAKKIHELIKEAKDLPDIREEKIARIKEEIANNTYHVSAQQLAAKMLSNSKE
jgi:negative regulator of flagellin synthesis FlgM